MYKKRERSECSVKRVVKKKRSHEHDMIDGMMSEMMVPKKKILDIYKLYLLKKQREGSVTRWNRPIFNLQEQHMRHISII